VTADPQVAVNDAGDRMIVWASTGGLYARFARAGHGFGRIERIARGPADLGFRVALGPSGRALVAWRRTESLGNEDNPLTRWSMYASRRSGNGRWSTTRLDGTPHAGDPRSYAAAPLAAWGAAPSGWVVWDGTAGVSAVPITAGGVGAKQVEMPGAGGPARHLDDIATGPRGKVAALWSEFRRDNTTVTYAALESGGTFGGPASLLPPGARPTTQGGRIAFDPATGRAFTAYVVVDPGENVGRLMTASHAP
jgi:hypothetical protein